MIKLPKFKHWEVIVLDWVDSMHSSKWRSSDEAIEDVNDDSWLKHHTIGFFLHESKESITVIQSLGREYSYDKNIRNVDGCMTIPKIAVTRVRRLNAKV